MHDAEAIPWLLKTTPDCDKGWVTDLKYVGTQVPAAADCHADAIAGGLSVIQRLDLDGGKDTPHDPALVDLYAGAFASYVSQCAELHVWVVGNEPNVTAGKSDPDCTSDLYAQSYVAVHKRVHALPGHESDLVLASSNSPYSPGCLASLRTILQRIKARGVTPDGVAAHAYTRAPTGSVLTPSFVTSAATQTDTTVDECPGTTTWNDTWHAQFRIYQDYIRVMEAEGLAGKPIFLTESGNACDVKGGNACYPDADVGYFQALYAEAAAHNADPATKVKIRAITPYRWTRNDDGTGRDFAIGERPKLLADLAQAFVKRPSWTTPRCGAGDAGPNDAGRADARDSGPVGPRGDAPADRGALGPKPVGGTLSSGCGCALGTERDAESSGRWVGLLALALAAALWARRRA